MDDDNDYEFAEMVERGQDEIQDLRARIAELEAAAVAAAKVQADLIAALKAMDASLCDGFDTKDARHAGRKALIAARAAIRAAEHGPWP